ncbi:MAG TPA: DMT family transporter [Magnetospirillaceae bacterium]|jgi:drug/metabolite transporter (DMT)-like permease
MSETAIASPASQNKWRLDNPLVAAGCVMLGVIVFASQDTLSKILVVDYSPLQIAWVRYGINTLVLVPFLIRSRGAGLKTKMPWTQFARSMGVFSSAIIFMLGLRFLPVADATAINFISPLLVTALSIPILGEKVGIRRWTAVVIGFIGMLIIVQPGSAAFQVAAFLPALSATCWGIALVLTRKLSAAAESSLTTITYSTILPALILSVLLPFVWRPLTGHAIIWMTVIGFISVAGQYLMILGFSKRPASSLAPFSYAQLIWATMYGYLVFGAIPSLLTWIGAAVVVLSGLYVLRRERIVKAAAAA